MNPEILAAMEARMKLAKMPFKNADAIRTILDEDMPKLIQYAKDLEEIIDMTCEKDCEKCNYLTECPSPKEQGRIPYLPTQL